MFSKIQLETAVDKFYPSLSEEVSSPSSAICLMNTKNLTCCCLKQIGILIFSLKVTPVV